MNDLISVIVPVYKVEKYLDKCVESIVNQTYKNLEIILVDDGSPDNCPQLCDEWAKRDSRIKVIHKQNGGLSEARNFGIDIAEGTYITLVDSDDVIALDMVQYLYDLTKKNDADMAVCQYENIDENGNFLRRKQAFFDIYVCGQKQCMYEFEKGKGFDVTAWGKLYKSFLFKDLRYPVGKYHEDVFLTYRLVDLCNSVVVGKEQKYFYRLREGSIMAEKFNIKHLDGIEAGKEKLSFMQEHYPEFESNVKAEIIWAVNSCVRRIAITPNVENHEQILNDLQSYYRMYEWDYLSGKSRLMAKMFSIVAWINLRLAIKLYRVVV